MRAISGAGKALRAPPLLPPPSAIGRHEGVAGVLEPQATDAPSRRRALMDLAVEVIVRLTVG